VFRQLACKAACRTAISARRAVKAGDLFRGGKIVTRHAVAAACSRGRGESIIDQRFTYGAAVPRENE